MSIQKDLQDLVQAAIISQETADHIHAYYDSKHGSSSNRLVIIFGILGALLIGLGIILIIAHNWDDLSRNTKTVIALAQLFIGQLLCGYVLLKKKASTTWRESTATMLFLAVGSTISLISQIYHLPGDIGAFTLTWMLLCWPLIYIMRSSSAAILFLIGSTYYAAHLGYFNYPTQQPYTYWLLLVGALPYMYQLSQQSPQSNFVLVLNWIIPISLTISIGTFAKGTEELMFVVYISLFGLFYLIGNRPFFDMQKTGRNGFKIMGFLGTVAILLALSFDWFWKILIENPVKADQLFYAPEFYLAAVLSILCGILLYKSIIRKGMEELKPLETTFVLFLAIFITGHSSTVWAIILVNLLVFSIGLLTIRNGVHRDHLGILNWGLLIITALVICRFFDSDLSFVTRGLLFVAVGIGFFAANYWMLRKRKAHVQ
jgi:uncharacterized membrane protein